MQTFTIKGFLLILLMVTVCALSAQVPFRMNVGDGGPYTYGSATFETDTGFDSQSTKGSTSDDITNTVYDNIYQSQRFVNGWGGYTESNWQRCGFTAGETYTMHLHFAEIYHTSGGNRAIDVSVEGNLVVNDMDVFTVAGHDKYTVISTNFTVSADGCIDITLANGSADFAILSAIEIVTLGTPEFHNTAFPVELVNFDAKAVNGVVALNWSTASEQNSDHFVVERSIDGENYTGIEKVLAQGNSSRLINYNAVDNSPLTGKAYYRLKDVDVNGAFAYSSAIEVSMEGAIDFSILSNASVDGQIQFRVANNDKEFLATVSNAQGKVISQSTFEGSTVIGTMTLGKVPTGIYYFTVGNYEFEHHAKLMVR